jgi:putative protease
MPIKKSAKKSPEKKPKEEKPLGEVTHFYSHLSVAVIKVLAPLSVGDTVKIKGATTNFEQAIGSMQVEHAQVQTAKKGMLIGMKVDKKVREGDLIYKSE